MSPIYRKSETQGQKKKDRKNIMEMVQRLTWVIPVAVKPSAELLVV